MHFWGDANVDWKGIENAAHYIGNFCRRWAFLGGLSKEKYGTVRFYAHFGELSLHSLVYPGYYYNQFPQWLWKLDCNLIEPVLTFLFGRIFFTWQRAVYSIAYRRACKKWPHLQAEILSGADYPEYIKGHIRIVETETLIVTHIIDHEGNTVGLRSSLKTILAIMLCIMAFNLGCRGHARLLPQTAGEEKQ